MRTVSPAGLHSASSMLHKLLLRSSKSQDSSERPSLGVACARAARWQRRRTEQGHEAHASAAVAVGAAELKVKNLAAVDRVQEYQLDLQSWKCLASQFLGRGTG